MVLKGYDNNEIADILEVSTCAVRKWRKKLTNNNDDSNCLTRQQGSGRPSRLSEKQKQQLKQIILQGAIKAGYSIERWTSKIIAHVIQVTFNVTLTPRAVRALLPTLGLSVQMPIVKSHKHDDEEVLYWAKHTWKRIKKKRKDSA